MLHTLIGYSDQPSVLQVVVYAATLAVIAVLIRTVGSRRPTPVNARRGPTGRAETARTSVADPE